MTDQPSEAYSQASEALTLDLSASDSAPHGSASATSSASKSSPSTGPASPATTTCENLARALPVWTYWPGDSRVSQSATQGSGSHKQTSDGYGPRLRDSFAYFDHERSCWRTSQHCLDVGSTTSSVTWPRAGMTRSGIAYRRQPLVPLIAATVYSSWPTPAARDHKDTGNLHLTCSAAHLQDTLPRAVHRRHMMDHDGIPPSGQLNPQWVEWIMGFPAGWTDLEASATQ